MGECLEQSVQAGIPQVSPAEDMDAWVIVPAHLYELPVAAVGQAPGTGVPTPDVSEQGLGCLAGMSVVNSGWEVSKAWALLSLSIHLPRAESLVLGRRPPEPWPLSLQVPARPQTRSAC